MRTNAGGGRPVTALLPIMAVVSIAFLIIGFALPVLPLHVHHGLIVSCSAAVAVRLLMTSSSGKESS